ncbi:MAG: hypothetical protein H0X40_09815 [Chthoniobacterales bacterium]|nr:hypothetical protein [Chthoniobacterales bacterium]
MPFGDRNPAEVDGRVAFDNLSRDADDASFAEVVQDKILARLANVANLKVISRTSTQHFKSTPETLPEIAATWRREYPRRQGAENRMTKCW